MSRISKAAFYYVKNEPSDYLKNSDRVYWFNIPVVSSNGTQTMLYYCIDNLFDLDDSYRLKVSVWEGQQAEAFARANGHVLNSHAAAKNLSVVAPLSDSNSLQLTIKKNKLDTQQSKSKNQFIHIFSDLLFNTIKKIVIENPLISVAEIRSVFS
jgi:hypothetical protein